MLADPPQQQASKNQCVLDAAPVEVQTLRHTPAGLPALDARLMHQGEVEEAGVMRRVQAEVSAVALGPVAIELMALPLGQPARFHGFLSTPRNSRKLVFHIQAIEAI